MKRGNVRLQQEKAYINFITTIAGSKDLHYEDKIRILEYVSEEMKCLGENLGYLECAQLLKELRGQEANRNTKAS